MEQKKKKIVFRNEWKYLISYPEANLLRDRLAPFTHLDPHTINGQYTIRSLYFDDYWDSAYNTKIAGSDNRKKWRIRIYNCTDDVISLERKTKRNNYIYKQSARLTKDEFYRILDGDYGFLLSRKENLCGEFYVELTSNLLRPKVTVDYERVPMILDEGTTRITLDMDVRAGYGTYDIFDVNMPIISAMEPDKLVLEVKWTEFLPGLVKKLLPCQGQEFTAVSKYTLCYEAAHFFTDVTAGISKTALNWRKER